MNIQFYASLSCPTCGNDVHNGVNMTFLEHMGLPVVPVDMFEQTQFVCECGTTTDTGELAYTTECQANAR